MIRDRVQSREAIIKMARALEGGQTYFKTDAGSIAQALIEASYHLEHGMSREEVWEESYREADRFMSSLVAADDKLLTE